MEPVSQWNDVERFFNLAWVAGDERRWRQPLVPGLTGGRGTLFGGCGLGAAIAGLERTTGRPLAWITAQFLAASRPPEVLEFTVDRLVEGRNLTQATVVARVADLDTLVFQAALGTRPDSPDELRNLPVPDVPGPDRCETLIPTDSNGGVRPRFDCRPVPLGAGPDRPGSSRWWFRVADAAPDWTGPVDLGHPAWLAVVLDFVPLALTAVLGRPVFGASLDNTVRVVERVPTEWVLTEFTIDTVSGGIAHVSGRVWSQSGALLVTGSQTCVVTERPST